MPDGTSMSPENKNNTSYVPSIPQYEGSTGGRTFFPKLGEKVNYNANPDSNNDPLKKPETNEQLEAMLANRSAGRAEMINDELLATASTPQELFYGLRAIEEKSDSSIIPGSLSENYRPPGQLSIMYNRAKILGVSNAEMVKRKWLLKYNPDTGEGVPAKRIHAGRALRTDEIPNLDADGEIKTTTFGEPSFKISHNFGTETERSQMAKAYERGVAEMSARSILGEHIGVLLNLNVRDSLEDLVNFEHGTTAKFKHDHLEALFNMPDVEEMATSPENHTLGDQVEEAMFLNLVILNSGSKKRMQEFLERPGAQHLISKLHKEEEGRRGEGTYTRAQWVKDNIGDVNGWVDDNHRDLEKTWKEESKKGLRGSITRFANIAAFAGNPGDFGADDETAFIEDDVGKLVGSVEASWVAATFMRVVGAYASEGYVALPNGKSTLPLGEGKYISSDDRGKLYAYLLQMKEGTKGRKSGLKDMIGKIPDMTFNLLDWAQVAMDDLPLNSDGTRQRRSVWDAWLGTPEGKNIPNLLTGEASGRTTSQEGYHRLGDLNFDSLDRDFHGTFGIMQWLIGRQGDGVFTNAMKVDVKPDDFTLAELKGVWKYIGIVMNPVVLTKGSTHLYDDINSSSKMIQKNFFRSLMYAKIHSFSFVTNVFNHTIPVLEPDMKDLGIPTPLVAKANIEEILKGNPSNEQELWNHYIDDYDSLIHLGEAKAFGLTIKTSGSTVNRIDFMAEKFIPKDKKEQAVMNYVGVVRGKNKF